MEEWVGTLWHRWVSRAASRSHPEAAVSLSEVERTVGLLFRAGGGAGALRVARAGERAHGGSRGWVERLAGAGGRSAQAVLDAETLALPPQLAVFPETGLNRDLYFWLAAQAACLVPTGRGWIADNRAATARALARYPGLAAPHARLRQAHLAQRERLEPTPAERAVRAALRAAPDTDDAQAPAASVGAADVAPVWLWVSVDPAALPQAVREPPAAPPDRRPRAEQPTIELRRRAERVENDTRQNGMVLPFRAEALHSWSEYVRANRGTDDDPDEHAPSAARDLDRLSLAPDGQSLAARVKFDLDLPSASSDDWPVGPGIPLPEWSHREQRLLPAHCAAQFLQARDVPRFVPAAPLARSARRVRRRLEVLRAAPRWRRGEAAGEQIDLDAWVRWRAEGLAAADTPAEPAVYAKAAKSERSLATLLLADLSLSTDAYATPEQRVIDVIRDSLYVFGEALAAAGDAFEVLGFSSLRRSLRVHALKRFDEPWNQGAKDRVGAIKPGYYTRLGAAIRLAALRLARRGEAQRLLLILTDGKPNDLDRYEGRWGLEDTRHAVLEARAQGLVPFCLTIDQQAHGYLPHLFGPRGWALVHQPGQLAARLAQAYLELIRP